MNVIYQCFPGGKHKALTMSYDDGRLADMRLVDIFNKHGVRGTFHLNAGLLDNDGHVKPGDVKTVYAGHEVAAHTYTHPTIARCPIDSVVEQVLSDRRALEAWVDMPVRGLSYPNGSYSPQIVDMLKHTGIRYARTVKSTGTFALPFEFYEWNPTCHHNHQLMERAREFTALNKKQYLYLMYVWGHSFEFDKDDNWQLIENFCEYIGGRDDIWYATNIEIADYADAFARMQFFDGDSRAYNPSYGSVWLSVNGGDPIEVKGGETRKLI